MLCAITPLVFHSSCIVLSFQVIPEHDFWFLPSIVRGNRAFSRIQSSSSGNQINLSRKKPVLDDKKTLPSSAPDLDRWPSPFQLFLLGDTAQDVFKLPALVRSDFILSLWSLWGSTIHETWSSLFILVYRCWVWALRLLPNVLNVFRVLLFWLTRRLFLVLIAKCRGSVDILIFIFRIETAERCFFYHLNVWIHRIEFQCQRWEFICIGLSSQLFLSDKKDECLTLKSSSVKVCLIHLLRKNQVLVVHCTLFL